MLQFTLLKNNAGLCVIGPQITLRLLHQAVHVANERSPLIKDKDGFFLGLAYDVRKAYEGQNEVIDSVDPSGIRWDKRLWGFKILWPVLLLQAKMLRETWAFVNSTKEQQAVTYALEAVIDLGLKADFGEFASGIQATYEQLPASTPGYEERKIYSRGAQYCLWNAKQRCAGLQNLLSSLDPTYPTTYEMRFSAGERGLLSPLALDSLEDAEWVDPKW
jgi:hypothetical protein